jgi:hypothetical protein
MGKQPLEYATVTATISKSAKVVAGGITNQKENLISMCHPAYIIKVGIYFFQISAA